MTDDKSFENVTDDKSTNLAPLANVTADKSSKPNTEDKELAN